MSPYGAKLSEFIKRSSLQQKEFAQEIGVLPNHVSQVISGIKSPFSPTTQEKINAVLKLTPQECREICSLSEISKRTFRLPEEADPFRYEIAALLCGKAHTGVDTRIEIARLALTDYSATEKYR